MDMLKTGVIGTSLKENEGRVPIHPDHFGEIPPACREQLVFEQGYGAPFGVSDAEIAELMGGVASREELLAESDISLLCKPLAADLRQMKERGILWGWPHCVQQHAITQAAIDRRLTLIAWEVMNGWGPDGEWVSHVFHRNNEIAGYAGVLHACALRGIDGEFGPARRACVINDGSVGQGALRALAALGFRDMTLFVTGEPRAPAALLEGVEVVGMTGRDDGSVEAGGASLAEALASMDVIVNAILQDPTNPLMYLDESEVGRLRPGTLIVDVSCDEKMGFPFARPTTFAEPMIRAGQVDYYAVDHTPSYLWDGASWEISNALLPYLPIVMSGPDAWDGDETVRRAIEIREGVILNPDILSFQKRAAAYPHAVT